MTTRQELIYYPETIELFKSAPRVRLDVPVCPSMLLTLVLHRDPSARPTLPVAIDHPRTWVNDRGHDWTWTAGNLRYGSCPVGGRVWLLMLFEDNP